MAENLLATSGLTKRFGGLVAVNEVALAVEPGEILAVIGPNGAGKTTLVAALSGELRPDAGTIRFAGADISRLGPSRRAALGIARSFQITSVFREFTALDNVALAVQAQAGHSFRFWRAAAGDERLREPARAALKEVGLGGRADLPAASLSHGERRALELAMAMASRPRLLLLDEPMAGMGPADSAAIVRLLAGLKGRLAIVLVEHDMDAVFALADRIAVMVYGRIIATGAPAEIRADPEVRRAYLGEDDALAVIPAQAEIQGPHTASLALAPRFRGGDDVVA
jgi:branched-chain amino acid transport system ATP-binding protein